jgi:6-phosphofructokinase 2
VLFCHRQLYDRGRDTSFRRPPSAADRPDMNPIVTLTINPALDLSTSVEELRPFSKLRCIGERRDAGGGGINVARVARRLGGNPLAIFPAGGPIGAYLADTVAKEKIRSIVVPIAGNTREDVTVSETASLRQFRFVLPGPCLSEPEWRQVLEEFASQLSPGALAVASGSLPSGVPDGFYADVAQAAKAKGARLLLDSSQAPLQKALQAGVYLIKPNLREFQGLIGRALADDASRVCAARDLIGSGQTEIVALSLADEGALVVGKHFAHRVRAPAVTSVSTVGAGDSFLGAFAAGLAANLDQPMVSRRAVAAGAAALLEPGTELCNAAKLERLLPDVVLTEA